MHEGELSIHTLSYNMHLFSEVAYINRSMTVNNVLILLTAYSVLFMLRNIVCVRFSALKIQSEMYYKIADT